MEATSPVLTETHHSTVTEDQIDHLGHMNVRFYGANATAATRALLERLGCPGDVPASLVDVYTRHHREQLLGAQLVVRSGVVGVTADGLRLYHELANSETGALAATFVHRVRVDGGPEGHFGLPPGVAAAARARLITVPAHGATRSISLESDPLATAPTLATLRARDLAIREVRAVSADECDVDGSYQTAMAPMLVWGGEPVRRRFPEMLQEGPNGERMGWASMETRLSVGRLPHRDDRIQSFSALVAMADKILHNVMWVYAVDDDELLVTFEIVNLAFDIGARRPMRIPDAIRESESALLQPDLAPATRVR